MLSTFVVRLVDFCRRYALGVVLFALVATIGMGWYVAQTFRINTDIDQLMAEDLDWRKTERDLTKAFPQNSDRLVIVVDGPNADMTENATAKLTHELELRPDMFKSVKRPDNIPYFRKEGILLLSEDKIENILGVLVKAQPLLGSLAKDPSLRGLFSTMALTVEGVKVGETDYATLEPSFRTLTDTMEAVLAKNDVLLPWQSMMSNELPSIRDIRKYIIVQPVLDFGDLSPGAKASKVVRNLAQELDLVPEKGIDVRLTGSVALNDEEFASVADGMEMSMFLSLVLVLLILRLALRSGRLILPITLTLVSGLVATTAFAMATIGSLNLISVAFAVMFVGIAVDFGIQFGVRFRDVHHEEPDVATAMRSTAEKIALPLALAALTTTIGFLAFIPTDYRGVSELGLIAGAGMLIAFFLNITLLPALLSLMRPPAEPEAIGYAWAAPIDDFLIRHRSKLISLTAVVALGAMALAAQTRFDFDPLNLKNPKTESVSTLFSIMKDPDATPYTIEILAPNLDEATKLADEIEKLPEVRHALTLKSFVPMNQETKLAMLEDAKFLLDPSLNPPSPLPAPTDPEVLTTLHDTASKLRTLGEDKIVAQKLADALEKVVARNDPALIRRLDKAMIAGMVAHLAKVREMLSAGPATVDTITDDLRRDWIAADGRAKIEVYPKGDARDYKVLTAFTDAVRKIAPQASGAPISIQESGKTVVHAFAKAGALGVLAIAFVCLLILRSLSQVVRLILPLLLAGLLTLATMVTISLPLNFANIIALPLLLSLGVSYAIYFVNYWRSGQERPLSSSTARAILFSASTTLVAFGSLALSSHPGTSGMGELLTIALIYSLLCTFIVLPILLGRPASAKH